MWRRIFTFGYLVRYLLGHLFSGSWRELTFPFSPLGRRLLEEGYSADIMRAIYERDGRKKSLADRIFFGHPLHRAVYDRLAILERAVEKELRSRLSAGPGEIAILTAPSGHAYDLFRPLERIGKDVPGALSRIRIVASDLDAGGMLLPTLAARAERIGVRFEALRGDLTDPAVGERFLMRGPYDVILFVGLSSWLPKPALLAHLVRLRAGLRSGGVLVTDAFVPKAYALSGHYAGFEASYYPPEIFSTLLGYAGFDAPAADAAGGAGGINHVFLAR